MGKKNGESVLRGLGVVAMMAGHGVPLMRITMTMMKKKKMIMMVTMVMKFQSS